MNLEKFPRRRYTAYQTPIEKLSNFQAALNGPNIYIKRDDLLGLTSGGNKTRKLEFLMGEALLQGADTILTCGAVQSNHCRLTLAAAVKEGLECHLILEERVKDSYDPNASGNNFLFRLLGATSVHVVPGGSDMLAELEKLADELSDQGKKPYIIPGGGSNALGALGYVSCAQEIIGQLFDLGLTINHIITPSGSAGTHSGLLAGIEGMRQQISITGISVNRPKEIQEDVVHSLTNEVWNKMGISETLDKSLVKVIDDYVGPGYSLPTEEMIEAVNLLAKTEGILLDPVYSGKAMAGLIGLIRSGAFHKEDNVLFIHTGGSPALYAYIPTILSQQ